jgi:hypothetical protein
MIRRLHRSALFESAQVIKKNVERGKEFGQFIESCPLASSPKLSTFG